MSNATAIEIYEEQEIVRLLEELRQKNKVVELMQWMLKNMKIIKKTREVEREYCNEKERERKVMETTEGVEKKKREKQREGDIGE